MTLVKSRIVIVGAGHAGGRAAEALRLAGHSGPITLIGKELHPPYQRPPLSKEVLDGHASVTNTYLHSLDFYEKADIRLVLGTEAVALDCSSGRITLSNDEVLPYDAVLLTMGARARRLPVPSAGAANIYYLRDIDDALTLRKRLVGGARLAVIGAGFIGLEVAAAARKRGCEVTLIELASQPLQRIAPPEVGAFFAALHQQKGVHLRLGVSVLEFQTGRQNELYIVTTEGERLVADLVLVGIGAVPNVELAKSAALSVDDGIVVNEFGQSSNPSIFAAGDVTRHFNPILGRHIRLEAWQNAQNQSTAVAKCIVGSGKPFAEVPWFWSNQYGINLQIAGIPDKQDELVWRGLPSDPGFSLFHLQQDKVVAATTVNNGRDMRFAKQLIARGLAVDRAALANERISLQRLCN